VLEPIERDGRRVVVVGLEPRDIGCVVFSLRGP